MSIRMRNVRFGFGFYLGLSACIHAVGLLFVSFIPVETSEAEPEEVVPAKVSFREPVQRSMSMPSNSGYMEMDSQLSEDNGEHKNVRQATGLPANMRRSPRPSAYRKDRTIKYAQLPDPSELQADIKPPEATDLPANIKKIEVSLGDMETIGRIPTVGSGDPETNDDLMSLGDDESESDRQRRLLRRPSFPYARARPHLPDGETTVVYRIRIDRSGNVTQVKTVEEAGVDELNEILRQWVNDWTYQKGNAVVEQTVTVQIPGA